MKLIHLSVEDFILEVDSKSPAPGGGSVSSLMSSMGVALARMVGHLTVEKKKFLALDSKIQFEFIDIIQSLLHIKEELIHLIDLDTEAFNMIMKAFQLPKITIEDIKIRKASIQNATLEAIMVPLKVATLSLSALHQFDFLIKHGNKQTISDLGVAILALSSGALGALMNVMINLPGLEDDVSRHQYQYQVEVINKDISETRDFLLNKIHDSLKIN